MGTPPQYRKTEKAEPSEKPGYGGAPEWHAMRAAMKRQKDAELRAIRKEKLRADQEEEAARLAALIEAEGGLVTPGGLTKGALDKYKKASK